ncbi:unnamed protein product [Soboliphyme baturini]|uniref:DUF305 domain-containing protein n=1 Tax=Soboliphyme baturini TaxID=241478 RepID=A0A183IRC0_9BILA|nr:unnamed protein product [Soboliphyme baturini]
MGALQTMLEKVCRMGTAHSPHAEYVANMKIHNEAALRTAMQEIESSKLAIDDEFRNRVQEISAGLNALSRCG